MLFSYQYVNHRMDRMQEFIDYIFYEVWCKAPFFDYDIALFDKNADLKEIIKAFHYTEPRGADFFVKGIQEIFELFKMLSITKINQMKIWYLLNNSIEELCNNDPAYSPSLYLDVNRLSTDLSAALKIFFSGLYSQKFLSLKELSDKIGSIDDHYNEFIRVNSKGKCPFCGLYDIDGEYVHTREAYDHYLPKSKYPFSSINFKNLAPICNKCNSGNKGIKDPLHDANGKRRKAFYSYSTVPYTIEIDLTLNSLDIDNLTPQDITITFGPASLAEEIQTWNELFCIQERYKDKCCSADAKYWISQILNEHGGMSPSELLSISLENIQRDLFSNNNFLRKPFLEACKAQHIFG